MPSQQPQVSAVQPHIFFLISASSANLDFEFAVLGISRVVIELRDLVHAQRQHAVFNFVIR